MSATETHPEPGRSGAQHPLEQHRVVGGFPYDTERNLICEKQAWWAGKLQLEHGLWSFPVELPRARSSTTGQRGCGTRGINKRRRSCSPTGYPWQSTPCAPVQLRKALSLKAKRRALMEIGHVAGVWFRKLRTEHQTTTMHRRTNTSSSDLVYTGEMDPGLE